MRSALKLILDAQMRSALKLILDAQMRRTLKLILGAQKRSDLKLILDAQKRSDLKLILDAEEERSEAQSGRAEMPTARRLRERQSPATIWAGLEATAGFEPAIRVLQTPPLGHLGTSPGRDTTTPPTWRRRPEELGAEDGIRTRDPHLGKVMLYH